MMRTQLRARPLEHYLYNGHSLLVTNLDGMVTGAGIEGLYFENTRVLSRFEILPDTGSFVQLGTSSVTEDGLLAYLQYKPITTERDSLSRPIVIELAHFLDGGLRTELVVHNYSLREAMSIELCLHVAADFADIRERESPLEPRQQNAPVTTTWEPDRQELICRYDHPQLERAVAVLIEDSPVPARLHDCSLRFALMVAPHESVKVRMAAEPIVDGKRRVAANRRFAAADTKLGRIRRQLRDEAPVLTTTNTTVARSWQTAVDDLASLPLGDDGGPAAPSAGMPLYQQIFGRDMLTIGWQALLATPLLVRDALRLMAISQGTGIDDWLDEEPGKLLAQARHGPLSVLGLNPFERYYGDYAAPPDFLIMLGQYLLWTGDLTTVRSLLPAARRVLAWMSQRADLDGDGFMEYVTRSPAGIKNQGWKDSDEAIVDEDGRTIPNPIAACELQGYWYAGLQQAAIAFFFTGHVRYAHSLWRAAAALKARFNKVFWLDDLGFYALGLDPEKRPIRTVTSNVGQALATGIIDGEKAVLVARRMMAPDMFSGWGIRTLSSEHIAYNPFAYHLGCVWPVDAGTTAFGLARYGRFDELHRLAEGLFAATDLFVANRLPEVLGGFPRDDRHPHPGIFPGSCEPQGWSSGALVLVIQALLGMLPVAPLGLLLVDPHLPAWLPELRLAGVRVGSARVDLQFNRLPDGETQYEVLSQQGALRVLRQPVPNGIEATFGGRLRAILDSVAAPKRVQGTAGGHRG